jgi:hypothetical protein
MHEGKKIAPPTFPPLAWAHRPAAAFSCQKTWRKPPQGKMAAMVLAGGAVRNVHTVNSVNRSSR